MTVSDHPPPYVHTDQPDELPAYSNSIHLVTLCRRKLEYTAPNVPARKGSRAWDFHWLVLSGTALSVYHPKRSEVKAHMKWEADNRAARLKEYKRASAARNKDTAASSPSRSTASGPRNALSTHPNDSVATRPSSPASSSSSSPSPAVHKPKPKLPFDTPESLPLTSLTSAEPAAPVFGGKLHRGNEAAPDVSTHKLVKQYAMNGATCVRAYDYLRRYFVLRIRADGQQFMVQLNSHPETLEWLAVSIHFLSYDER